MPALADQPHSSSMPSTQCVPQAALLDGMLAICAKELGPGIAGAMEEFARQLIGFGARDPCARTTWTAAVRALERGRAQVEPRFLDLMKDAMASAWMPDASVAGPFCADAATPTLGTAGEDALLFEMANAAIMRNEVALALLGQRFGAVAAQPAFDADRLPVGPNALCRAIAVAIDCLALDEERRLLFLRAFDRQAMPRYRRATQRWNRFLAANRILPDLQCAIGQSAGRVVNADSESDIAPLIAREVAEGGDRDSHSSFSVTPSPRFEADISSDQRARPRDSFEAMRQALAERRRVFTSDPSFLRVAEAESTVDSARLQDALRQLQAKPAGLVTVAGKATLRTIGHLKQDLLALLRQTTPTDAPPVLSDEDADAIELVDKLFERIAGFEPGQAAAVLLSRLQVPILRAALQDKEFFACADHPARRLLGVVLETAAHWLGAEEADDGLAQKLDSAVERATREFENDCTLFDALSQDIESFLETAFRKAEVAERRHADAARGKEKLALARARASLAIASLVAGKRLPDFVHALLAQAWTDALALTALRHGEDSDAWKKQLGLAERIVRRADDPNARAQQLPEAEADALRQDIEKTLTQVGYQDQDSAAVARCLTQGSRVEDWMDAAEQALRIGAVTRPESDVSAPQAVDGGPLDADERVCLAKLRLLPFGTWFEFAAEPGRDRARRKLSWFSVATGQALFVNRRGQKSTELTLEALARLIGRGQARVLGHDDGSLLDRAWREALAAPAGVRKNGDAE